MAKCRSCKKNISDGAEYCDDCFNENISKNDEDYLDNLLNFIKNPIQEPEEPDKIDDSEDNFLMDEIEELLEVDPVNQEEVTEEPILEDDFDMDFLSSIMNNNFDDENNQHEDNLEEIEEIEEMKEMEQIEEMKEMEEMEETEEIEETEETEEIEEIEDDLSSLLKQMNSDDPIASDIKEISDIISGEITEKQTESESNIDVGDVFSEALKVVSSLDDEETDEALTLLTEEKVQPALKRKSKKEKKKKEKKIKEKKPGLIKRVFANVEDPESKETSKKKDKKKKESKTDADSGTTRDEQVKRNKEQKKEQKKADKEEQKKKKEERKKQRKDEKEERKKKAAIEILDEIEDQGSINPLGASIVFAFFGILLIVVLIGSNVFSYSLNIKNATNYFNQSRYTEAYNEVYGVDINESDIELYDKIMTVMFVNKQLNSYNSYYAMGKYPEALDSLLKGMQRYDKYIEFATIIGVMSDLDYVKTQIIHELDNVFQLSEEEAYRIINSENQTEYSIRVYDVILENNNFYSLKNPYKYKRKS